MQWLKVKDKHITKILTKKAVIAVLLSGKRDFKTKALLEMEELLHDKRLRSSRRYNSFKHYARDENLQIYKVYIGIKEETDKTIATVGV